MIQSRAYPNPTVGAEVDPSNDGSTAAVQGFFVDQKVITAGKLKLQEAAAQKDLENAELALRKARNDLATQVRTEYFQFLVAKESIRVTRALARFTDEVYRIMADQLVGGQVVPYEPAALRAQAYTARLAYKQSISTYLYQWKQLTAVTGLRQLPLSEVSGRIDAAIPYYDYDAVLSHVLHQHTDVQTARNSIEQYRYSLKLAQVVPVPAVDVLLSRLPERADIRALTATLGQAEAELQLARSVRTPDLFGGVGFRREAGEPVIGARFGLTLPLFQRQTGAIATASGRIAELKTALAARRVALEARLRGAHARYLIAAQAAEALTSTALPLVAENEQLTRDSYQGGKIGLIEMLLVRRVGFAARQEALDAQLDATLAGLEVRAVAGVIR